MNLEDAVRGFCSTVGLKLNTDLGQHFLTDQDTLDAIVDRARLSNDDRVIEIGPGIGVLTAELCRKTDDVTVIEIDRRMPPLMQAYLVQRLGRSPNVTVINDNALDVELPSEPYKMVANIPYHITSPLFRHAFLESKRAPTSMTLLIQKEVAKRICDDRDASLLSIIVRLFGEPEYVRDVPPDCFLPPPKVDSAVLHVECRDEPLAKGAVLDAVFLLTKTAFAQKRKKLHNSIGPLPGASEALERAGISSDRRPQSLAIEEWITFATEYAG